jgi:hypothetical protein
MIERRASGGWLASRSAQQTVEVHLRFGLPFNAVLRWTNLRLRSRDYVELPSEFLPAGGERTVESGWVSLGGGPGPKPVALVFRAGIDSKGRGVGDPETVEWMRKSRASREEERVTDKPD